MLKERHRYGAPAPRTPRTSRAAHRSVTPPEVGIIPGNRFFLLPLKKVSALVRHHDPCRGFSATATKTCIQTKGTTTRAVTGDAGNHIDTSSLRSASRLIVRGSGKQRRRQAAIARTPLGPISEQDEGKLPLLNDQGNWPWSQGTSSPRTRKLYLERSENARRMNTHVYFRKPGPQVELNSGRFTEKVAAEPLERALPRGARAVDYLSLVMVESAKKSAHVGSPRLSSRTAVVTKLRSKNTSVFNLDQRPAQQAVKICGKFGLQGASESVGGSPLPDCNSDGLVQRSARVAKTRFSTERESIPHPAATTLKQEGQPRRSTCRKFRKLVVLPRLQAFGRNRISPSDHQILLPTDQYSEKNSIQVGVGDRFGRSHEVVSKRCNSRKVGCSAVHPQSGSTWGFSTFLCSLANEDDLPIGPLRTRHQEQVPLK